MEITLKIDGNDGIVVEATPEQAELIQEITQLNGCETMLAEAFNWLGGVINAVETEMPNMDTANFMTMLYECACTAKYIDLKPTIKASRLVKMYDGIDESYLNEEAFIRMLRERIEKEHDTILYDEEPINLDTFLDTLQDYWDYDYLTIEIEYEGGGGCEYQVSFQHYYE